MKAAVLAIVLTHIGAPAQTLLCVAWCAVHSHSSPAAADCHGGMASIAPAVAARDAECEILLKATPFVREDAHRIVLVAAAHHGAVFHVRESDGVVRKAPSRPLSTAFLGRTRQSSILRI